MHIADFQAEYGCSDDKEMPLDNILAGLSMAQLRVCVTPWQYGLGLEREISEREKRERLEREREDKERLERREDSADPL